MNWDRVREARLVARSLMALAVLLTALPLFLFVAAPVAATPMLGGQEPEILGFRVSWLPVIGIGGMLIGLVWMWRIYKSPTKYEGAQWRFRDH